MRKQVDILDELKVDQFIHFAVTVCKRELLIYMNGHQVARKKINYPFFASKDTPLYLQSQSVDRVITPMTLYNGVLTPNEVSSVNNQGILSTEILDRDVIL